MRRILQISVLIIAGEMVFSLPFHTARFFRPTLLDVFEYSNTQLGDIFAVYGVTAMVSYFPGGVIADMYSARTLISVSLLLTGLGGLYMATIPGPMGMALVYGYFGVTNILMFWAALLKATREWGGNLSQGKAFGILDGGRGFVASAVAVLGVALLASYMPDNADMATDAQRRAGFSALIVMYSLFTMSIALLTWLLIPAGNNTTAQTTLRGALHGAINALPRPIIWAQAGIIVCAYCGYKGLDNYSLYAVQVLGMDQVEGARFAAYAGYLRLPGAVAAGLLADRIQPSRALGLTFGLLTVVFGILFMAIPEGVWISIIYANVLVSFFAVYALRGIYFALIHETRTPKNLTGTTIGVVSFIGFTPEIFFGPITGRILDASPGVQGHQNYFLFLSVVALIGMSVVLYLIRINRPSNVDVSPNA